MLIEDLVYHHLSSLALPGNHFTNIEGIELRSDYIQSTLRKNEISFELQEFTAWGRTGVNIIVNQFQDGIPNLILGVHYDTVPFSPGANDNSSSLACILSFLDVLRSTEQQLYKATTICFWDMEEVGKKGSEAFIKTYKSRLDDNTLALVFDMVGWCSEKPFSQKIPLSFVALYPMTYLRSLLNLHRANFHLLIGRMEDFKFLDTLGFNLKKQFRIKSPNNLALADYFGLCDSDHHNFWLNKLKSVLVTDSGMSRNSVYHTDKDNVERINITFAASVCHALIKSNHQLNLSLERQQYER